MTQPRTEFSPEEDDPALARLERDRKPGELESGMLTGTDDGEISATERFEGELEPEEALQALAGDTGGGERRP
jgi:hypothetical protein